MAWPGGTLQGGGTALQPAAAAIAATGAPGAGGTGAPAAAREYGVAQASGCTTGAHQSTARYCNIFWRRFARRDFASANIHALVLLFWIGTALFQYLVRARVIENAGISNAGPSTAV